jgi:hypothetical protein
MAKSDERNVRPNDTKQRGMVEKETAEVPMNPIRFVRPESNE